MKPRNKYWRDRAIANEKRKEALSGKLSNETKKIYRRAYKSLTNEINALLVDVQSKPVMTRTDLYNLNHYNTLKAMIGETVLNLAKGDCARLTEHLQKLALDTYEVNLKTFGKEFSIISQHQAKALAEENWSGAKYSDRIWSNANKFNARVMEDIEKMIIDGKNPDVIKKRLMEDFGSSYYEADRLIRTESSHIYNTAAIESYKEAGISSVQYLAEDDCCELCEPYSDEIFEIDLAPQIPVHPNCRCTYIPVVD